MDPEIITLIVVSIIGSVGSLLSILHLKKCHSGCIDSECFKGNTPSATPLLRNELITHLPSGHRPL